MPELLPRLIQARKHPRPSGDSVLDVLMSSSGMAQSELAKALAAQAGVSAMFDASQAQVDYGVLAEALAQPLGVIPLRTSGGRPAIGMADPWDDQAIAKLVPHFGALPELVALPGALLTQWSGEERRAPLVRPESPSQGSANAVAGPVVEFVNDAINAAFRSEASDVHFECDRHGLTARLRQDGVLVQFARLDDTDRAEEVISRVKVLAQLDITERRVPQDGRFRAEVDGEAIDMRVSVMPSIFGEDAVLRLLDKTKLRAKSRSISLDLLGFDTASVERIRDLAELPAGMLLVTGPTGSGKTTTVYAVLSEFNNGQEKIVTIEDPVEYELAGVLQIPVNERKGLTFAKGLRSILRHDPDRILVGEIRDGETAEIAVQSALTGHQVFTTVHANNVFDITGRFRHFGLDMFGFMASLNGMIVQRLVRTLCPHCAMHRSPTPREERRLATAGVVCATVASPTGCEHCRHSGYLGRRVLAEVHAVDDRFRDLVTSNAPVSELRAHVEQWGVMPLVRQAAQWVAQGRTSMEEVTRVVGWQ